MCDCGLKSGFAAVASLLGKPRSVFLRLFLKAVSLGVAFDKLRSAFGFNLGDGIIPASEYDFKKNGRYDCGDNNHYYYGPEINVRHKPYRCALVGNDKRNLAS